MDRILITGAGGFVGRNLVAELKKESRFHLFTVDIDNGRDEFEDYLAEADFVVHLAGVNRPKDDGEFWTGNTELTEWVTERLSLRDTPPPLLITSSVQSDIDNAYGRSKRAAEQAVFDYGKANDVSVYVYKLPNLFGKWSRPNYNSVVSTFCHNIARGMEIQVNEPERELTLCYIDDLLSSIKSAIMGTLQPEQDGYCRVKKTYSITLQKLADTIAAFRDVRTRLVLPNLKGVEKALYSTYLSYLEPDDFSYELTASRDSRGSFYEIFKTKAGGQVSMSTTAPGVTRGNHWHHSKVEKFVVISGVAVIRFRGVGETAVTEYTVNGEKPVVVDIPAGYTHSITNISKTKELVTLIWANEQFDADEPDTFYEEV